MNGIQKSQPKYVTKRNKKWFEEAKKKSKEVKGDQANKNEGEKSKMVQIGLKNGWKWDKDDQKGPKKMAQCGQNSCNCRAMAKEKNTCIALHRSPTFGFQHSHIALHNPAPSCTVLHHGSACSCSHGHTPCSRWDW